MVTREAAIRGRRRLSILTDLASGDYTNVALAEKYGVSHTTIGNYAEKYRDRIETIRQDVTNELAGLWVAQKKNRLAEYEQQIEDLEEAAKGLDPTEITPLIRAAQAALRAVAEELGDLPQRIKVESDTRSSVRYSIEGVDPKDLT